jgi:di/tricarboxylate transporter
MMAASASFATPIGYQTNLMVYGPGGYRFSDYLRIGVPLNIVLGLVTVLLAPLIWPF